MSTRCRIGIYHDGKYESIYCHHDGYTSYVGRKLQEHYNDAIKVRDLMKLGDISSLGDELKPEGEQKFDDHYDGKYCRPYKLRGEDCPSKFDDSLDALLKHTEDCWGEYLYVFDKDYDGIYKWFVWEIGQRRRLSDELEDLERKKEGTYNDGYCDALEHVWGLIGSEALADVVGEIEDELKERRK